MKKASHGTYLLKVSLWSKDLGLSKKDFSLLGPFTSGPGKDFGNVVKQVAVRCIHRVSIILKNSKKARHEW